MYLTKKQRKQIWDKSAGKCWYCGCDLPEKGWHVDHVEAVYRYYNGLSRPANDHIENLVPACAPCNLFKTVHNVETFRSEIQKQVERARKYSVNFRMAERFGMIKEINKPVVFWYEKSGEQNEMQKM